MLGMGANKRQWVRRGTMLLAAALLAQLGAIEQARGQQGAPYMPPPPPPAYPPLGWAPPPPPPQAMGPRYDLVTTANRPLVIAGAVTFAVSHFAAVSLGGLLLVASAGEDDGVGPALAAPFFLPIIGPAISLQMSGIDAGSGLGTAIIADSVLQGVGFGMLVAGLSMRTESIVRADVAARPAPELFVGPGSLGMRVSF